MVPPELLTNLAVLYIEQNQFTEARAVLEESIKNCEALCELETQEPRMRALRLTTRFNYAYCLEHSNELKAASEIYHSLIRDESTYTDAYLRLACIEMASNKFTAALELVE